MNIYECREENEDLLRFKTKVDTLNKQLDLNSTEYRSKFYHYFN